MDAPPLRIGRLAATALASGLLGTFASILVWDFLYGVGGERVLPEELCFDLGPTVWSCGGGAGALSGLAGAILLRRGPLAVSVVAHGLALSGGCIAGSSGWALGLSVYFGVITASPFVVALWRHLTSAWGPSMTSTCSAEP